ncbi:MAG: tRNA pseudouridine(38-40) synthase TruA [Ignavibacteria bacterium]|jgi:tRNA pseudouridine38-40 synthase
MPNYKLTIQYDGTGYAGWQIQKSDVTVQGKITEALEIITKEKINLIGSGRTDAGVHALGQVANFQIGKEFDIFKLQHSLNSMLPENISIEKVQIVNNEFHSRFDAKQRSYVYLINTVKSPFYYKYAYFYQPVKNYPIKDLNQLSKTLIGRHDFTSLSKKNIEIENKECEIFDIHWRKSKDLYFFYINANRYLHGMVRTIVGTILEGVKCNCSEDYLLEILEKKNREEGGKAVPAKGLFLYRVRYSSKIKN